MEFEKPVIETSRIGSIEVVEAEVEVEMAVASDQSVGDRLPGQ